jgi:hypothetical protein
MVHFDRSYRQLFTQPGMIASLLGDLLGPAVTGQLDFSTLERVPDSFVGPHSRARQADMLWRLRRPDGRIVYVLLEFQSDVQRFMPVRVLNYVALVLQELVDHRILQPGGLLPEILTIVIYNGQGRWRQPTEVAELISAGPTPGSHVPHLRFVLVDLGSYPAARLEGIAGPVGVLLLLERSRTLAELERGVRLLIERVRGPQDGALRRAFVAWILTVLLPGRGWADHEIPALVDLEELREMLEKRVEQWSRELIARGRKEGLRNGVRKGEAGVVLRQLELKFGPLDEPTVARVRAARAAQLRAWAERLLTAATLTDVFQR